MNYFPFNQLKRDFDISIYKNNELTSFVNPYSYLLIRKKSYIAKIDKFFIDGILLVSIANFFTKLKIKRNSFDMTGIAPELFVHCINNRLSVYFIGSTNDYIGNFVKTINKKYTELNIIGYRNGYFNNSERNQFIEYLSRLNPDVVIVGMGGALQEKFLIDLRKKGWQGLGFTCGGFIHQTSERIEYYPYYINQLNLRWLFRIFTEPKLIIRYLFYYPIGVFLFFKDYLSFQKSNK